MKRGLFNTDDVGALARNLAVVQGSMQSATSVRRLSRSLVVRTNWSAV